MAKRKRLSNLTRRIVYLKCDGHCAYCGTEIKFEEMQVDHVVPINGWSEQGEDTSENLLPACRSCNHYKSRSTLEGFRKMLENMPSVLMRDSTTYRNAVRFGLVEPTPKTVVFYFEKMDAEVKGCCLDCGNSLSADAIDGSHVLVCFNCVGHEGKEMVVADDEVCKNYN